MSRFPLKPITFFYAVSLVFLLVACGSGDETIPKNVKPVQLEFFETYSLVDLNGNWQWACRGQEESDSVDTNGMILNDSIRKERLRYLVDFSTAIIEAGEFGTAAKSDLEKISNMLERPQVKKRFPDDVAFLWGLNPRQDGRYVLFAVKVPVEKDLKLTGKDVQDVEVITDEHSGEPVVSLTMTPKGAKKWELLTARNVNKVLAVTIDRKVITAPRVNEAITGGKVWISGNFTVQEAEDLVMGIKAGKR